MILYINYIQHFISKQHACACSYQEKETQRLTIHVYQRSVTVKGKTDINGKPFKRQKRTDDERSSNAS